MKPTLAALSISLLFVAGAPALAQTAAQQKEEVVCQLLNNCGEAAAPAGSSTPAGGPQRGTPRTTQTRGFSLARPKAEPATAPVAAAPARSAVKSAAITRKPVKKAAQAGAYDLNVTFRSGSAELAPSAKSRATMFASALQDPRIAGRRVRIEGHTDSIGSPDKNKDLSERRARSVADLLVASGVQSDRLDVAGYGSGQPLPGLATTNGAQRRVVAVLVK